MSKINNKKLISIIVPVYNREQTLPRLFQSLLQITYHPLEIVFVDNYSQDRSLSLCEDFKCKHHEKSNFEILVTQEKSRGACACRNQGLLQSHGDYLYFFDSDDEISSNFITDISQYIPCYDVICAPTRLVFADKSIHKRDCIPSPYPQDHILSASISTQSFVIRKSYLEGIGLWDNNLLRWNDWELGIRILCHQPRIKWITQQAYHKIYQHKDSISGKSYSEDYLNLLKSIEKAEYNISTSTLGPKIKRKSYNALFSKCLLLSANLYKEGDTVKANKIYQYGKRLNPSLRLRFMAPVIYYLAKINIRGMWRILLSLV